MSLMWKESMYVSPPEASAGGLVECSVFLANSDEVEEGLIKLNVIECIDKSVALLSENITDNSLYYLCEWDAFFSTLTIVVTDETKSIDSKKAVKCCFNRLNAKFHKVKDESEVEWAEAEEMVNSYADDVRGWIRDYLTTCSGFMDYSLVAAFHSKDRKSVDLL